MIDMACGAAASSCRKHGVATTLIASEPQRQVESLLVSNAHYSLPELKEIAAIESLLCLARATRCGSNTGLATMLKLVRDRWSAHARVILLLLALATLTCVTCRTTLSELFLAPFVATLATTSSGTAT